jgi:hypothetical protein
VLAVTLVLPLAAGVLRRGRPQVPLAVGAYVAYLLHAIVDWDWQVVSLTLAAVICAAALCLDGAGPGALGLQARRVAIGLAVAAALLGFYGIVLRSSLARIDGTAAHAARAAQHAADLQPWSTEPWQRLATVDANGHRYGAARVALHKAIAKDPDDWSIWFALAQTSNGRERAGAMARTASLDPRSPELATFRRTLISLSGLDGATK